MPKQKSRPTRWQEAVAKAQAAFSKLEEAVAELNEAREELDEVRQEYEQWKDNLPENLQNGALAEKLDAVSGIDTSDEVEVPSCDWIEEAEGADLPQGFGRD